MELHILGLYAKDYLLREFIPTKPTYAIRIWSSFQDARDKATVLLTHRLFKSVREYTFDDVWPGVCNSNGLMFEENLAQQILEEFNKDRQGCEALLVHCSAGKNRSPAVAMALNEVFKLGHNTAQLKAKYPQANWYVYKTLIEKAKELRF